MNMALEATHIRFTFELKDGLGVKDREDYIVGCSYPDSRYMTRTARPLTHPPDYRSWDLASADDFKKGWYTHLLCDQLQSDVFREKFPHLFAGEIMPGNPAWIKITALKVLQDIDDAKRFDVVACLPRIERIRALNNEDMDALTSYYRIIREVYSDPSRLALEDYGDKLARLGLGKELATQVIASAREFIADDDFMTALGTVFSETIARAGRQ